jgi:hypothetical protein
VEALNVLEWKKKLSPAQRTVLGLPAEETVIAQSDEGLHPIERLFQSRFRALRQQQRRLPLDQDATRGILGRLAKGLARVPFGGEISVSREKMDDILQLKDRLDVFAEIAVGIGFLVEEPKGYFRFADDQMFEYFTSVW